MNIDIAYIIILLASNIATYYYVKRETISQTLDFLRDQGMIDFED